MNHHFVGDGVVHHTAGQSRPAMPLLCLARWQATIMFFGETRRAVTPAEFFTIIAAGIVALAIIEIGIDRDARAITRGSVIISAVAWVIILIMVAMLIFFSTVVSLIIPAEVIAAVVFGVFAAVTMVTIATIAGPFGFVCVR